jgi:PAS domain S-box-containing protein
MSKIIPPKISKPQSLRVLMVEDSESDELLIIRELKKGGYEPEYERVETAAAMKKALKEKQWDIILCDYKMPEFNAPSAIAILKEANIDIPLIIVSGTIGEETAVECMRLGAHDYFMKSNLSRICQAIARELEETEVRSKQKQAEEELRFRNILLATQQEVSIDGILVVDENARILLYNRRFIELWGLPAKLVEDGVDEPVLQFVTAQVADPRSFLQRVQYLYEHRQETSQDELVLADGRFFDRYSAPMIGSDKRYFGRVWYFRDITERKQAEQKIYEAQQVYRALIENSPDIIARYDRDGRRTYVNPMYLKVAQISQQELLNTAPKERSPLPAASAAVLQNLLRRVLDSGVAEAIDVLWPKSDNIDYWYNIFAFPEFDREERVVSVMTVSRDITERKRTDEALRNSEGSLRTLVHTIPDLIWLKDPNGVYLSCNAMFERFFGASEAAIVGKTDYDFVDRELADSFRENDRNAMTAGKPTSNEEWITFADDGHRALLETIKTPMYDVQGILIGVLGIGHDITDRKQASEQIRKALESTVQAIAVTVETRDPYTAGHQRRVADLARAIATEMNLPLDIIEGLRMAASIHDLGKISVPAEILSKPTKLTNIEFMLIKAHSQAGYDILKDIDFPWPLAQIVYQHHERMDGSGYPRNLKGDEIIMEARIIAVADVMEAMASHRPYRPALGIDTALAEIEKNKGTFYDNAVADACLRLFREKGFKL